MIDGGQTMGIFPRTYEQCIAETMAEFRAEAASMKTYGDWFRLEERLRDELAYLRESIKKSNYKVSKRRAWLKLRRFELEQTRKDIARADFSESTNEVLLRCAVRSVEWAEKSLARAERNREAEQAARDEIKAALRYHDAEFRAEAKLAEKLRREMGISG